MLRAGSELLIYPRSSLTLEMFGEDAEPTNKAVEINKTPADARFVMSEEVNLPKDNQWSRPATGHAPELTRGHRTPRDSKETTQRER
jgi:hypothetical protein